MKVSKTLMSIKIGEKVHVVSAYYVASLPEILFLRPSDSGLTLSTMPKGVNDATLAETAILDGMAVVALNIHEMEDQSFTLRSQGCFASLKYHDSDTKKRRIEVADRWNISCYTFGGKISRKEGYYTHSGRATPVSEYAAIEAAASRIEARKAKA